MSKKKFTQQETFDIVVTHLRKQGKPAVQMSDGVARCRYRTRGGLKCAAGCLISDEDYTPAIEDVRANNESIKHHFAGHDIDLVQWLQIAHDESATRGGWYNNGRGLERALREIAKNHKLNYQPDQTIGY